MMQEHEYNFDEIHSTYRAQIHRYLTRMVGADGAEDLTQEVFIKVNRNIQSFKGESSIV